MSEELVTIKIKDGIEPRLEEKFIYLEGWYEAVPTEKQCPHTTISGILRSYKCDACGKRIDSSTLWETNDYQYNHATLTWTARKGN